MIFGLSPLDFQQFKLDVIATTGLAKDALHIYAGLAIFLAVRLFWRWRGGWLVAWLCVLAVACGVEYVDMLNEHARDDMQPDASHWHDIWNTMFWPTVLVLVGPRLQPKPKPADAASSDFADKAAHDSGEQTPTV
jgi:hypothetical protein